MAADLSLAMNVLAIVNGGGEVVTGTKLQLKEVHKLQALGWMFQFPEGPSVKTTSGPRRYYVSSAFIFAINITEKKAVGSDTFFSGIENTRSNEPDFVYYLNDEVYGSFTSKLSKDLNTIPKIHKKYEDEVYKQPVGSTL